MEPAASPTDRELAPIATGVAPAEDSLEAGAARAATAPSPEARAISDIIAEVRALLDRVVER